MHWETAHAIHGTATAEQFIEMIRPKKTSVLSVAAGPEIG
jgi:hypothetical protein